ncbi:MAG: hypothetical protein IPK82_37070 [Polyangiaceae bacterium]|nr:hypothetical protein [Polyangiaceae bacterium]
MKLRTASVLAVLFLTTSAARAQLPAPPSATAGDLPVQPTTATPLVPRPYPLAAPQPQWVFKPKAEARRTDLDENREFAYVPFGRDIVRVPAEFEFDPDVGVPPGYRRIVRERRGLMAAGSASALGLWLVSALAGLTIGGTNSDSGAGAVLALPVLGPFLGIQTLNTSAGPSTLLAADGLLQAFGWALFIGAARNPSKVLRHEALDFSVAPSIAPGTGALTVRGSF